MFHMKHLVLLCLLLFANVATAAGSLKGAESYPASTPGAVNPDITQDNYRQTICSKAHLLRPGSAFTNKVKRELFNQDKHQCHGQSKNCELDHRVPICAGGEPTGPGRATDPIRQLWLEPHYGTWTADQKDKLEMKVCAQLCAGKVTLHQAQQIFLDPDWTVHYRDYK